MLSKCRQVKYTFNEKGYILIETITLLLIFSVIVSTIIALYGQSIKGRESHQLYYQAIMIARSEMEKQVLATRAVTKRINNMYNVEVSVRNYSGQLKEVKVIVKWKDSRKKEQQIDLKRLIYQPL